MFIVTATTAETQRNVCHIMLSTIILRNQWGLSTEQTTRRQPYLLVSLHVPVRKMAEKLPTVASSFLTITITTTVIKLWP